MTNNDKVSWEERKLEIIKSIMYADDVDWEMDFSQDSLTYAKSWQLHKKIDDVLSKEISSALEEQRKGFVEKIEKDMPTAWFPEGALHIKRRFLEEVLVKLSPTKEKAE